MLKVDYHTHTVYSHGTGSVEENVQVAIKMGIPCLGIAEHGGGHVMYGVRGKKQQDLRRDVEEMNRRYGDRIRVLYGLEANLIGMGKTDARPTFVESLDFVLLGYHRGVVPKDGLCFRWMLSQAISPLVPEPVKNALAMCRAIERTPKLVYIAHPGEYIPVDIKTLARCAAEHQVGLEINARHLTMSVEQLKIAAEEGASFYVGSDAHSPGRVGDVMPAVEHAKKAGVLERVLNWSE